jgi:hypothetical protein
VLRPGVPDPAHDIPDVAAVGWCLLVSFVVGVLDRGQTAPEGGRLDPALRLNRNVGPHPTFVSPHAK